MKLAPPAWFKKGQVQTKQDICLRNGYMYVVYNIIVFVSLLASVVALCILRVLAAAGNWDNLD